MKIYTTAPLEDPRDAKQAFRQLEEIGYDGAFSFEAKHDPFLPLVLAAENTERLMLGTAIAIAFARNPMTAAPISFSPIISQSAAMSFFRPLLMSVPAGKANWPASSEIARPIRLCPRSIPRMRIACQCSDSGVGPRARGASLTKHAHVLSFRHENLYDGAP